MSKTDYIIMNKCKNGEYKPVVFNDGRIPIYNDKDEAICDMDINDVLFKIEEVELFKKPESDLENIIKKGVEKAEAKRIAQNEKSKKVYDYTARKASEIVEKLSFLTKYGFSFKIKTYLDDDYGYTYMCNRNYVLLYLGSNERHFATLGIPYVDENHKCDYDFYSYQVENGCRQYTYKSFCEAIAKQMK